MKSEWSEIFEGGSASAEEAIFHSWIDRMFADVAAELADRDALVQPASLRWMHTKTVAGIANGVLLVDRRLPAELAIAHFQPGAVLPLLLRFSNASRIPQVDYAPDLRGAALRLALPSGGIHDMLLASYPTSIARNARQFVDLATMFVRDRESLLAQLACKFGEEESHRIACTFRGAFKLCSSLSLERYWSGTPFLWGELPVRFELRPIPNGGSPNPIRAAEPDSLRLELAARLAKGDVRFRFAIQCYADEGRTPVEDSAIDWNPQNPAGTEIATVVLPAQRLLGPDGRKAQSQIDGISFNPWNAPPEFRPLGSLNRIRRLAYDGDRCARQCPRVDMHRP